MWDRQLVRWLRAAGSMQRVGAWIVALVSGFALAAGAPLVGCEAQVTSGEASDADTWSEADSPAPSVDEGLSLVTREGELVSCASPYNTCGASTASLWGVTAYSNAPHQGTTTPCNGLGSHGYQYQCVQYVNRFFMVNQIPGLNTCSFTGVVGNACQWWANAATSGSKQNTCGLSQIPTGSTNMPMPGDVWIYYNGTSCSSSNVGHIAVVHSVTDQSVTVIEQNWACNGLYTHSLTKGGSSSYPTWTPSARGTYKVVGWLRHPHFSTDETTEASPLTITNQSDFGGVINKDNDEDWFKFRPADFIGTGSSLAVTLTARRRDNSGFDAQMDIKNSQKVSLADYGTYQYYRNDDEYDVVAGHATGAKVTAVIPAAEKNNWFYV